MITVALPTWKSSPILWLQLESLCRQVDAPKFEVIVMEDPSINFAGEEYVMQFADRMREAGGELRYVELEKWISLGSKWREIALIAKYDIFCLAASDNYSPPDRLKVTAEHFEKGCNWFDVREGLFYNVKTGRSSCWYNHNLKDTGLFMATKTDFIKNLNGPGPRRFIDNWIRSQIKGRVKSSELRMSGLHTDGYNNISIKRGEYEDAYPTRFKDPYMPVEEIVPKDIWDRLISMKC